MSKFSITFVIGLCYFVALSSAKNLVRHRSWPMLSMSRWTKTFCCCWQITVRRRPELWRWQLLFQQLDLWEMYIVWASLSPSLATRELFFMCQKLWNMWWLSWRVYFCKFSKFFFPNLNQFYLDISYSSENRGIGANRTMICFSQNESGTMTVTQLVIAVCAMVLLIILLFLLFKCTYCISFWSIAQLR